MKNFVAKLFAKLFGGGKSTKANIAAFEKASTRGKDAMRNKVRNNINKRKNIPIGFENYRNFVHNALRKKENGQRLSTTQKKALDLYDHYFANEEKKECIDIHDSKFLLHACYYPKTKTVFIQMRRGKMKYPFFRVPKTKWAMLATGKGEYMWDWFGRHYSANPGAWVRKGK